MREVVHEYGVKLDWMDNFVQQMDGHMNRQFMMIPDDIHTGTRYICPISENITAFVVDVEYHQDVLYKIRNTDTDFVCMHFNLTEGQGTVKLHDHSIPSSRWTYNIVIMDAILEQDYQVKAGSKSYLLHIFIKKDTVRNFISALPKHGALLDTIFNPSKHTFIKFDNMTPQSWWLMNELRKIPIGGPLFDLFCAGTVYSLLAEYIEKMKQAEIIIQKVVDEDISNIFKSQAYLIAHMKHTFPGIPFLAEQACMSPTKYKNIFKLLTTHTPNSYFSTNKLIGAKEMLEKGGHTISEVAHEFNFPSPARLSELFKTQFGTIPKDYLTRL